MQTKRLTVRRFCEHDVQNLYLLLSDADVMRYLEPPFTWEKTEAFIREAALQQTPLIFAVDDLQGNFVGYVIYHAYDADSYEIGWVLHKSEWHKGYADELTRVMIDDASAKGKNLVIECVPEQTSTKKIALKHGFQWLGHADGCDLYKLTIS